MIQNTYIQNLISLLDDSDEQVYVAVKYKLIEAGPDNLPLLESALKSSVNLLQHDRLEFIIDQLKIIRLGDKFSQWAHSGNKSLLQAWALISSIQKIEISTEKAEKLIQQIIQDIWMEINDLQTSFEKIAIVNHIFFNIYRFELNYSDISATENCFINNLLISRKGNQISLTILYCIIAKQLNLPVHPISINYKMFIGYMDPEVSKEAYGELPHPFLFFINMERKGGIVGIKEMEFFLKESKEEWSDRLILNNELLIGKLLTLLKKSFQAAGEMEKSHLADDLLNKLGSNQ